MTFRQNAIIYRYGISPLFAFIVLFSALIPVVSLITFLVFAIPCVILIFVYPKLMNTFIAVDAWGICCVAGGKQLWGLAKNFYIFRKLCHKMAF